MLNIIVASKNFSKINSVTIALTKLGYDGINIVSFDVDAYMKNTNRLEDGLSSNIHYMEVSSDVSSKPINDETILGVTNRLNNVELMCNELGVQYDYLVAIEGGYLKTNTGCYLCTYAGVRNINGVDKLGMSSHVEITNTMFEYIKAGNSINKIIEEINNTTDNKRALGIIGALTNGLIDRKTDDSEAVMYAFIPHFCKNKYDEIDDMIKKKSIK